MRRPKGNRKMGRSSRGCDQRQRRDTSGQALGRFVAGKLAGLIQRIIERRETGSPEPPRGKTQDDKMGSTRPSLSRDASGLPGAQLADVERGFAHREQSHRQAARGPTPTAPPGRE
jgi:hypothetical protein